jgi:hypothetical protein
MNTPSDSICAYLRAKDGNRPHLLSQAFTDDALLEMNVKTGAISFPPVSRGRGAIADVLVRRFAQTYENVYTLCLAAAPKAHDSSLSCDWLVAMTEKESGAVRVGCGRYDWYFSPEAGLAESLVITIETMQSLPSRDLDGVMAWISSLPYPWCAPTLALRYAPDISDLSPVFDYIGRNQDFIHSSHGEQRLACPFN